MASSTIEIRNIKIILNTNIPGKASFPLTKNVLVLNDLEEKGPEDSGESSYPFFTMDVELPLSEIEALGPIKSVELFFNKEKFRALVASLPIVKNVSKNDNARKNVLTMLNIFFPTSFPIEDNISDSFRTNIQELQTVKPKITILPKFMTKFLFHRQSEYSYIRTGGSTYTVVNTIWVNDILNHPEYRKLVEAGKGISQWWENKEREINTEISERKKNLIKLITDHFRGAASSIAAVTNSYIQQKLNIVNSDNLENDAILDSVIDSIFELYFYVKYNEKESSSRYSSRDTNRIPFNIRSEFQYDKIESIGLKIYKLKKTIEFFKSPSRYTELFETNKKKEDKSIELLKSEEIKSEIQRFGRFLNFLKMAYQFSTTKRSSNLLLRNMIYFYLNSTEDKKIEKRKEEFKKKLKLTDDSLIDLQVFLKKIYDYYIKKKDKKATYPIESLETGVDTVRIGNKEKDEKEKDEKEKNDYDEEKKEEYEIQIQLDVVKGVLNDETVGKISCMFRDKNLMNMYNALTNEKHNKYEINKKRFFIDIEDLKKQQRIKEESLKKEKDSVQKDSYESVPSEPLKKGGKTRRYMKKSNRRTRSR